MLQIESLRQEIGNLNEFQTQLQSDYDTVQGMVEGKQKQIEHLSRELEEMRPQAEGISSDIQVRTKTQKSISCQKGLNKR